MAERCAGDRAPDPQSLRILISNDDGINAPGLRVLEKIARDLSDDITVVAPETEQSGAGHSLTLRRPLRIRQLDERRFSVDGTPTDCVTMGIRKLMQDRPPTLMLSGVNRGGNLGEDVTYSGTVAAAFEATLLGIPAIALSQEYVSEEHIPWDIAAARGPDLVRRLCGAPWPPDLLYNVNFPSADPPREGGVHAAFQGRRAGQVSIVDGQDPRGRTFHWIGDFNAGTRSTPGSDLETVHRRMISVTPLHMNMTHCETLAELGDLFQSRST